MIRSITTWARIEPEGPGPQPGPDAGLQARVYDAAWLLGRQWQLGELSGEDAGSPAWVRARLGVSRFTRLRRGDDPAGPIVAIDADDLLEPLVEAESARVAPADWTAAAQAGAHFLAVLAQQGLAALGVAFAAALPVARPRARRPRRGGTPAAAAAAAARLRRPGAGPRRPGAGRPRDSPGRRRPGRERRRRPGRAAPVAGVVPGRVAGNRRGVARRAARVPLRRGRPGTAAGLEPVGQRGGRPSSSSALPSTAAAASTGPI